jgi:hypothetical protein
MRGPSTRRATKTAQSPPVASLSKCRSPRGVKSRLLHTCISALTVRAATATRSPAIMLEENLMTLKKTLLATAAAFTLAAGAAQAEDVVKVETVGPWSIAYNKDKQTCNAYTQFGDTIMAIGHRENVGIWHLAVFTPWANWFADDATTGVKVSFDFGHRKYLTNGQVEAKKDPNGNNKRLSFPLSGDMLVDFANSSSMQVKATVNGHEQATPYMDLKGARNLIARIEDCQDTAVRNNTNFSQQAAAPTNDDLQLSAGEGCQRTVIERVGGRLEGAGFEVGVGVHYSNDVWNFSYGGDPAVGPVSRSVPGDLVIMCLVGGPRAIDGGPCPKGDNRGSVYRVQNLRTRESWTLPDSPHMCGGA